jgi:hypothetical protein
VNGTSPAEQHLGDRLAALVDGELGHDARERVQAHLATCPKCKAEADAQRRLKSVFAQVAPPPPSAGLLARLQGLPGGPAGDDDDRPGRFDGGGFGNGVFGVGADGFGYAPADDHAGVLPGSGFRIHEVGRQEAERSSWRARRFAFAAASAVSFAAMALGGSVPLGTTADAVPGAGNNVTPTRTTDGTAPAGFAAERRRGGSASVELRDAEARTVAVPPAFSEAQTLATRPFTTGVLNGSSSAPWMRLSAAPALQIDAVAGPGPSATPGPGDPAAPALSALPLSSRH